MSASSVLSIEPCDRSFDVIDAEGNTIAHFGRDRAERHWWVVAGDLFTTVESLPPMFGGHFYHRLPRRADVLAMFGIEPGAARSLEPSQVAA